MNKPGDFFNFIFFRTGLENFLNYVSLLLFVFLFATEHFPPADTTTTGEGVRYKLCKFGGCHRRWSSGPCVDFWSVSTFLRSLFCREKGRERECPRDEGDSGWLFRAFRPGGAWRGRVKNWGGSCILEPALSGSFVNLAHLLFLLPPPTASPPCSDKDLAMHPRTQKLAWYGALLDT